MNSTDNIKIYENIVQRFLFYLIFFHQGFVPYNLFIQSTTRSGVHIGRYNNISTHIVFEQKKNINKNKKNMSSRIFTMTIARVMYNNILRVLRIAYSHIRIPEISQIDK